MAHEITSTDSLALVGDSAWHGLGTVIPRRSGNPYTTAEILPIAFARQDGKPGHWDVEEVPSGALVDGRWQPMADSKVLVRNDTRAPLATVSAGYGVLSVAQSFRPFDPWVQAGVIEYETAGSLQGGRRLWICARLCVPTLDVGPGDKIAPYLLLSNNFAKAEPVVVKPTGTRTVCANTLRMGLMDGLASIRVRHTRNVVERTTAAVGMVDDVRRVVERQADAFRKMVATRVHDYDLARYAAAVWRRPIAEIVGSAPDKDGKVEKKPARILAHLTRAWDNPRGGQRETTEGTAWGLYQALTDMVTHGGQGSTRTAEDRLDSVGWGGGAELIDRGEVVADVLAEVGLRKSSGLTWEDLIAKPTSELREIVATVRGDQLAA